MLTGKVVRFFDKPRQGGKEVIEVLKPVLWWMWFLVDPKGCLTETTNKKEREAMGVEFDR